MNELINLPTTMSSREIAVLTGKKHKDVLESIRNMEPAWVKITGRKFPLSEYKDSTGRKLPMYELSKTECLYVATKFNDEARAILVIRWEVLDSKEDTPSHQLPQSYSEALRQLADSAEEKERLLIENKEKEKQLEEQAPKVHFAESFKASSSLMLIRDLAKYINQNISPMGGGRFYDWLVQNNYMIRTKRWSNTKQKHEYDYMPTQRASDMKIFHVTPTIINSTEGQYLFTKHTVKVNAKGQSYFINKFLKAKNDAAMLVWAYQ